MASAESQDSSGSASSVQHHMKAVLADGAVHLFNKAKTTVRPFEQSSFLITRAPYRFSRHPMYLGLVVLLIGVVTS